MSGLPVSDVVNISVSMSQTAAAVRSFGSLLILGSSNVIPVSERRRAYSDIVAVGTDFGTTSPEYKAAALYLSQKPQPAQLYIGCWDHANETLSAAVVALMAFADWYGLTTVAPEAVDADHLAVAALVESATPSRVYGVTSQDPNALVANSTTDLPYKLSAAKYSRTCAQYSSSSPYAVASLMGRAFGVDFSANNSIITLMFKDEPGVTAENLTESQSQALKAKNCNAFVNFQNSTAIIEPGTMASGAFFDVIQGADWQAADVQAEIYKTLYGAKKVPQTDAGANQLLTAASASMDRGVKNGLWAPGVWTGPTIGPLNTGDTMTTGFIVYASPMATQSSTDRAARKSPALQIAGKLAGAIHSANVIINVNS